MWAVTSCSSHHAFLLPSSLLSMMDSVTWSQDKSFLSSVSSPREFCHSRKKIRTTIKPPNKQKKPKPTIPFSTYSGWYIYFIHKGYLLSFLTCKMSLPGKDMVSHIYSLVPALMDTGLLLVHR